MNLLCKLALFRVINALLLQTSFHPDEYWQSLEVAHKLAFGYGHLTWEWAAGLRSYAHPLLFAAVYKALQLARLDSRWAVWGAPRVLQGLTAAAGDLCVYRLTQHLFGHRAARWALVCQLTAWFNAFCLVRTFSNSLEAVATTAALHAWLASHDLRASASLTAGSASSGRRLRRLALVLAGLGVVLRPPSAAVWVPVGVWELCTCKGKLHYVFGEAVPIAGACAAVSLVIDRICYGRWVFSPWEFVKFNLLQGGSAQFGAHPLHWNFTAGFPAVAASLLPIGIAGIALTSRRGAAWLVLWSLAIYSAPAHKEFRFLLPALQLLMPYCGLALAHIFPAPAPDTNKPSSIAAAAGSVDASSSSPAGGAVGVDTGASQLRERAGCKQGQRLASEPTAQRGKRSKDGVADRLWPAKPVRQWTALQQAGLFALAVQLLMAVFFAFFHQRGTISAANYLAQEAAKRADMAVLFLTPCHATPCYCYIHRHIPMRFPDCSPPGWHEAVTRLNADEGSVAVGYLTHAATGSAEGSTPIENESAKFDAAPLRFLRRQLDTSSEGFQPTHIVMFDNIEGTVAPWLRMKGYQLAKRWFHAIVPVDERGLEGAVLVFEQTQ